MKHPPSQRWRLCRSSRHGLQAGFFGALGKHPPDQAYGSGGENPEAESAQEQGHPEITVPGRTGTGHGHGVFGRSPARTGAARTGATSPTTAAPTAKRAQIRRRSACRGCGQVLALNVPAVIVPRPGPSARRLGRAAFAADSRTRFSPLSETFVPPVLGAGSEG